MFSPFLFCAIKRGWRNWVCFLNRKVGAGCIAFDISTIYRTLGNRNENPVTETYEKDPVCIDSKSIRPDEWQKHSKLMLSVSSPIQNGVDHGIIIKLPAAVTVAQNPRKNLLVTEAHTHTSHIYIPFMIKRSD